jgi:hypothetical protein
VGVYVLLLRWKEDDLNVDIELKCLAKVFQAYKFTTETFLIPSMNSQRELTKRVVSFLEHYDREDELLVVYYGGHGTINQARQATWWWYVPKHYFSRTSQSPEPLQTGANIRQHTI